MINIDKHDFNLINNSLPNVPRVLIIDDEVDAAVTLKQILKLKKIEVVAIGYDGAEAVELYKKHKPDVTILDFFMSGKDGLFALNRIKRLNPNSKVMMLTGHSQINEDERFKNTKADAIFMKPYDVKTFVNKVFELSNSIQIPN